MPKWSWQRMQSVHVELGGSIKTSADYSVWGLLVDRSLAVKRVKRLRPHHDCWKRTEPHSQSLWIWSHRVVKRKTLPSHYFTQQENLGCPEWQNNIRAPEIQSRALSLCSGLRLGGQTKYLTQAGLNFFPCHCEVLADNNKNSFLEHAPCICQMCSPPQREDKLVSVSADGDAPGDRSAFMQPCMSLCLRSVWQVETQTCFRWPVCWSMAPCGDAPWHHTAVVSQDTAAGPAQEPHRGTQNPSTRPDG